MIHDDSAESIYLTRLDEAKNTYFVEYESNNLYNDYSITNVTLHNKYAFETDGSFLRNVNKLVH
jgi:hypothetical protein